MLLKEICTTDAVFCGRDTSVLEAARTMREKHVGDLVVVDDPGEECTPVGLITDRDIVVKVLGNDLDPRKTRVAEIMRTPIVCARENEDAEEGMTRMCLHGVRRLPVVNADGQLTGIVTMDDLLKLIAADANSLIEIVRKEQDHEHRTCR